MSVQRMINSKFWSDTFVVENLNPLDRYLFLYLLTNERTNLSGVYEAPLRIIANETGLEKEEIVRMLERLKGRVEYKDGWVCLVKFIKYQNVSNASIKAGINNKLEELPKEILEWVQTLREDTRGTPVVDETSTTTDKGKERKEKENKDSGMYTEQFEEFWTAYPEKKGKGKAYATWNKISVAERQKCLLAIKEQVENNHFRGKDQKDYIPHPTTWLNQRRWEDEIKGKQKFKLKDIVTGEVGKRVFNTEADAKDYLRIERHHLGERKLVIVKV